MNYECDVCKKIVSEKNIVVKNCSVFGWSIRFVCKYCIRSKKVN